MPIDLQRLQSVFQAVAGLPPAERAALLERECGGDAELRCHLEALLKAHDDSGELPAAGAAPTGAYCFVAPPGSLPTVEPGQLFAGRYKLREKLGEGGMGVVFVADQTEPVQRRVALKIIRAGLDTHRLLARFEQERQALALMDHPNIAKVFDAGMDEGQRPYFAMELVKGLPLTKYCDDAKLSPRQRLELFIPVCQAVQHAHQKGIIHRDLKPSNILVGLYDGRPVPKVIDFGVAKATGPRLTEQSVYTEVGSIIGTLEYMSPEQAELNNLDIDTRSDIYALGVILYELLTGTVPFSRKELEKAGLAEMLRIIKEIEPPKPSTKLSHSGTLPSIAAQRQTEPRKLTALVRGELDWIVMKALEKDRGRRYETANGFAMDVQRYLAGESVLAAPASQWYRLRKFVRRHRAALWTTGVVAAALVAGTVVSAWQAVRATQAESLADARLVAESQARKDADANFQKARQAVDEYFTVVSGSPLLDAPGLEPLRKQLLETALRYNREFIQQHSEDADLQADVAAAHSRVSEIIYLVGGSREDWFPHMRDAADIVSRLIEEHRDTPEVQQRLARIHLSIGRTDGGAVGSVDTRDVVHYLQKQAQNWEKFVRDNPDDAKFQNTLGGIYYYLAGTEGVVSRQMGWINKAVQIWEKLARENSKVSSYRIDLAKSHEGRGRILSGAGRGQEADQESQRALRLRQELDRDFPGRASHSAWLAVSYRTLGEMQSARKEFKDAEKTLRSALELQQKLVAKFPSLHTYQDDLAITQQDLGAVLKNLGKSAEAEAAYRQALGGFGQLVVAFPRAARYQTQFFQTAKELAQQASGQPQKKREILDVVFAVYEKLTAQSANTSEDLQAMAVLYQNLAKLLRDSGQPEEADKAYGKGLAVREKLATDFPQVDRHVWDLALCYIDAGHLLQDSNRPNEAAKIYERARKFLEARRAQFPEQTEYRAELARIHNHIGWLLASSGRQSEAEKAHRQALDLLEKLVRDGSKPERSRRHRQELSWTHEWLGHVLTNSNRPQEAEKAFRQAIALGEELHTEFPNQVYLGWIAKEYGNLATLFIRLRQWDKAEKVYRDALEFFKKRAADFPREPNYRVELGHTLWKLASILSSAGRRDEAEKTLREALTLFKTLAADYPRERYYRQETAFSYRQLCDTFAGAGRAPEEKDYLQRAAEIYATLLAEEPNNDFYRGELSIVYGRLAHHFIRLSQWDKAAAQYAKADLLARPLRDDAFAYACLLLIRGDSEGYDRFCQGMIQHAGQMEDRFEAFLLARTCAMAPKSPVDPARMVQWANQAVASDNHAWYVHVLGLAQYRAGQLEQALQSFAKANVESWASRDLNWLGLALVHHRLGHPDEALQCFDKGIQWLERYGSPGPGQPANIHPVDWVAAQVLRREALALAVANCREAIERDPKDAKAHYNLGVVLHHQGALHEAVAECRKAVELDPKFASAHEKLGTVLRSQGKLDEAVAAFQEVLRLKPDFAQTLNNWAWGLATAAERKNRDGRQAVALARLAVKASPADGNLWNTLGAAYYSAGNWKAAIETLQKAEELYQGQFFGNDAFFIAMARWQLGDKDAARKWYLAGAAWMERYAAKDEEQRRFRAEAATLLGISVPADPGGQLTPQDERQLYTLILDAYPEGAWAYFRRGLAYVRAGEAQKAQTDYQQAVALYTRAIQASARWALFANRANTYAELGQWEKASADYAKAIQDEACDVITRYRHGLLCLHLGDRDGYRKACSIMLDRFSKQDNVAATELALWVCVLAPDAVADHSRLVQWAERLLAAQPNNIVYMNTLGATLYRAGRFEDALKPLSKASTAYKPADELRSASAYNSLFLAMAHWRLHHAEEARKWLRKATSKIDASEQKKAAGEAAGEPVPWNRRLTLRLLRTEAETLMKGRTPASD